jgi:hypothetical protein
MVGAHHVDIGHAARAPLDDELQDDPPERHASGLTLRNAQSLPPVSMCTRMLPWLLPVGLLGTVALISLSSAFAYLLAGIWCWLVFPCVAAYVCAHSQADGGRNDGNGFRGGEADYWRTKLM